MSFTQTFLSLLKATTGIQPNDGKIITRSREDEEDGYVLRETELEDPEAQILSLEAFEMKLRGEKEDTKTVSSSLNWSDEIEQILVKYRENLRLRNPKRWTKETILRKFRTLRMQDMNVVQATCLKGSSEIEKSERQAFEFEWGGGGGGGEGGNMFL